jgi:hypothetical protein
MKFSNIEFCEEEIIQEPTVGVDAVKRESIGCIQLLVQKSQNAQLIQHDAFSHVESSESVKVWERKSKQM